MSISGMTDSNDYLASPLSDFSNTALWTSSGDIGTTWEPSGTPNSGTSVVTNVLTSGRVYQDLFSYTSPGTDLLSGLPIQTNGEWTTGSTSAAPSSTLSYTVTANNGNQVGCWSGCSCQSLPYGGSGADSSYEYLPAGGSATSLGTSFSTSETNNVGTGTWDQFSWGQNSNGYAYSSSTTNNGCPQSTVASFSFTNHAT